MEHETYAPKTNKAQISQVPLLLLHDNYALLDGDLYGVYDTIFVMWSTCGDGSKGCVCVGCV